MKNLLKLSLILLSVIMTNAGCSDDDDDNIRTSTITSVKATVDGIGDKVDKVRFTLDNTANTVCSEAEFKNNSFEFSLMQEVNSSLLKSITTEEAFENMSISDTSAKICFADFYAFKNGEIAGYFLYNDGEAIENKNAYYIYTDKDVQVTGKHGSINVVITKCSFKKGWNLVTGIYKGSEYGTELTYTTDTPKGLKWVFIPLLNNQ